MAPGNKFHHYFFIGTCMCSWDVLHNDVPLIFILLSSFHSMCGYNNYAHNCTWIYTYFSKVKFLLLEYIIYNLLRDISSSRTLRAAFPMSGGMQLVFIVYNHLLFVLCYTDYNINCGSFYF